MSSDYATPPPQGSASASSGVSFMERTFPVGSVFGIPVKLHALFPAYIVVTTVLGFLGATFEEGVLAFLVNGPVLFGTVLVHELGHCFATWHVGGEVHEILLWPLGGLAYVGHDGDAGAEVKVALAGPLTHLPQTLIWLILLAIGDAGDVSLRTTGDFFADLCRDAIVLNLLLFLFNLCVPAYPLDGGRILSAGLLLAGVPVHAAANITVIASGVFGLLIVVLGFVYLNFLAVFVGGWVLSQANNLRGRVADGRLDQHPVFAKYVEDQRYAGGWSDAEAGSANAGAGGLAGALGGRR